MNLNITCIGSCRLSEMKNVGCSTQIASDITLTHTTKDALQVLKWLSEDITLPVHQTQYMFHRGMWSGQPIILSNELKDLFRKADVFIIEICSYNNYVLDNYYYYQDVTVDINNHPGFLNLKYIPENIRNNVRIITDGKEDIEADIDSIIKLIGHRKLIIVTHILDCKDSSKIPSRQRLINDLTEICNRKQIPVIYPGDILKQYNFSDILEVDYTHYKPFGLLILRDFYEKQLNNVIL
jgi:hypothetical protein